MNFAIVPAEDSQLNDRLFRDDRPADDRSVSTYHIRGLRREIEARGDQIHTIDKYADDSQIDYCILEWPYWKQINMLRGRGLLPRTIYANAEPVSVIPDNCPEGYQKLKKIYPYILTWNKDWTDGESVFLKNIPYPFVVDFGVAHNQSLDSGKSESRLTEEEYKSRKLLTAITADKHSDVPGELYSERRNVYSFFETNYPDDFDFYGIRWKKEEHPGYKGTVEDKLDVYHNYRFAICLENTRGASDYVTEKIYDCLCAGIVPIYGGTENISEYVPRDCFIDYFSFDSYEEMASYLQNMSLETYNEYRDAIYRWLAETDHSEQSIERYVELLYEAVSHKKNFKISIGTNVEIMCRAAWEVVRARLVEIKHKLAKRG